MLNLEANTYLPPANSVPGAGGVRVLEFRAKSAGIALIQLLCRRPWEIENSLKNFEVTVNVGTCLDSDFSGRRGQ